MKLNIKNPFTGPAQKIANLLYAKPQSREQQALDEEVIRLSGGKREAAYAFRVRLIANLLLMGTLLLLVCAGTGLYVILTPEKGMQERIPRDDYGGETRTLPLEAQMEGESEAQLHEVSIRPRAYSDRQAEALLEKAQKEFDSTFLQENRSRVSE